MFYIWIYILYYFVGTRNSWSRLRYGIITNDVRWSLNHRVEWGNYIQAKDDENYGFMIGGHGMADVMCAPQYGFAYLDTTNDRIRLFYFEVSDLAQMTCHIDHLMLWYR